MKSTGKILLLAASTLLLNNTAQAEAPMNVDDAGTLAVGGMKVDARTTRLAGRKWPSGSAP